MNNRLTNINYTKKGVYSFESFKDKEESHKFWARFNKSMKLIEMMGIDKKDVNSGVLS